VLDRHVPGAVQQAITDADTMFGIELPALGAWTFGPEQGALVEQPVLSVLGRDTEPLWVEVAARLRSWLPRVEEATIEGVGHFLHMQSPAPVANELAAFLGRHPLAGARAQRERSGLAV
jgi:pimeloyl-ACP methyl ester carboxylesterase